MECRLFQPQVNSFSFRLRLFFFLIVRKEVQRFSLSRSRPVMRFKMEPMPTGEISSPSER